MTAGALFDEKYSNVKNTFIIRDDDSVYRFIENNENLFDLLEKNQTLPDGYFGDGKYYLEVHCYPEIYEKELALIIKVDYSRHDFEKLNHELTSIFLEINDYKLELGLLGKFYMTTERIQFNDWGDLRRICNYF